MANIFLKLEPITGAAEYFADVDVNLKPCVWKKDNEGYKSVIDTAKTIEQARIKANKWQQKENMAVLSKNLPQKLKTAAIYIYGLPQIGDKPEAQKTVHYTDEKKLVAHLKKLQKGFCDENERTRISKFIHPKTGKKIIECSSDSDFSHVAFLGMRINPKADKPVETIN